MRVDFYGLAFETPRMTFYLWTPWRASALEHRLMDAISKEPGVTLEKSGDEKLAHVDNTKTWRTALQAVSRVLKGWQEEADPGSEKRTWYWLWEGDTDAYGYDHNGESASLWGLLRVCIEHGGPEESNKHEHIDLEEFGVRVWPANE